MAVHENFSTEVVPSEVISSQVVDGTTGQMETAGERSDADVGRESLVPAGRVDMLEAWADEPDSVDAPIALVRINNDETAMIPFTSQGIIVKIHYCDDPEIQGYVRCNGDNCLLCRIGRNQDERLLLPIYVPASRSICVLAISPSSRPGAPAPAHAGPALGQACGTADQPPRPGRVQGRRGRTPRRHR